MRISDWSSDVCSSVLLQFRSQLATAVDTLRARAVARATDTDRYSSWIQAAEGFPKADLLALAIEWSKTNILIERDRNRIQAVLDLEPLPIEERENRESSKLPSAALKFVSRSEERRVGKEWVSPCRSRWSQDH